MEFNRQIAVKLAIAAGVSVATFLLSYWIDQRRRWVKVGNVTKIWLHPIKSTRRHSVTEADCTPLGPVSGNLFDRRLVIVSFVTGKQVTARDEPKMVLFTTNISDSQILTVSFEENSFDIDLNSVARKNDRRTATVWNDVKVDAYDCGDGIADWLCKQFDKEPNSYRLCYLGPNLLPRPVVEEPQWGGLFSSKDVGAFEDLSAYMFMCESSVTDLNDKTEGVEVSAARFRPNVMISGTRAFDEDFWEEVKIGDEAEFRNVKPCTRCIFTTIDPETGVKNERSEPLKTLRSYRSGTTEERKLYNYSPKMGINTVIRKLGSIRLGDPVYVTYKESK